MKQKLNIEVSDALANKFNKEGIDDLRIGGVFRVDHIRGGEVIHSMVSPNIVVNEGLNYILDVALSAAAQNSTFYVGIFSNNYAPQATDTMSTFAGVGVANEITTEVTETVRPTWTDAGAASQVVSNTASPAVFTANTTVSAYGAFLSSDNVMDGTVGILVAASKFPAVRDLINTDTLNVTYTLNIADA